MMLGAPGFCLFRLEQSFDYERFWEGTMDAGNRFERVRAAIAHSYERRSRRLVAPSLDTLAALVEAG
jgi:hypothetical protein